MSNHSSGPTSAALSLQVGGEVEAKGNPITVTPGGEPHVTPQSQQLDPTKLTDEEKAAAEQALKDAQEGKQVEDGKAAETTTEEKPKELTPEEQTTKDLDEAKALKESGQLPEHLKDLPAEEIAKFAPFTREFNETQDLKPESIAAAAKAFNVPEAFVKQWVAGLKAEAQMAASQQAAPKMSATEQAAHDAKVTAAYDAVGGKDNWQPFVDWANNGGLTSDELADLATAVNTSPAIAKRTIAEYTQRFNSSGGNPKGPLDLSKGTHAVTPPAEDQQGFSSKAEQHKALRDPRYNTDPKYRAEVDAKIVRSTF